MKTLKSFYEQNGGTYTQVGDVLLPNLSIGEDGQQPIGKYGRMRKHYLKEQHPVLYSELLLSGPENCIRIYWRSTKPVMGEWNCLPADWPSKKA